MRAMRTAAAWALSALIALPGAAAAAEDGKISVEFNALQPAEAGCRAVFVLYNGLDHALDDLGLRIVSFDGTGHAQLFLSLDVGALPVGKTRILRFDLGADVACQDISRVVLDDVTACEGGGADPAACLAALSLSSRAGVPFDL